ncbi:membrane lipoprotein lipid attachment site-containing protein [Flaviaesturariibacter amylovorans]|uniref:Type IV secretion system putative lipoprotein virB7 n=1 Tax=Flaviaesturariibacter amylovorans TaxID=1084520 RepID=A0ABP8HUS1_9BACT
MKRILFSALIGLALAGCSNATDGNANTDTTNFSPDTGAASAVNDTAKHINTASGEYPNDTIPQHNVKGDVRSSSPSPTQDRSTTPGNDSARQRQY